MLSMLLFTCLAFKALASQISGFGDTIADYGGEAHYKCKLDNPNSVLQVTWQRFFQGNFKEDLATYSEHYGEQVNDPYQGKITFTEASLKSTSITVENLTWADESCYVCSFSAYPDGSKRHQTCLTVQGVSEVQTQVHESNDESKDKEVTFSCSATGKPAPIIQWDTSPHAVVVDQSQSSLLTNGDRTFTSSRNITLQLSSDWDGQVDCLINTGMRGERRTPIIFTRNEEKKTDADGQIAPIVILVGLVILVILVVAALLIVLRKRIKHQTRNATDIML